MKKKYYMIYTTVAISMVAQGCKKPYLPVIIAVSSNYLVVEGIINTGSDSTSIQLSRTVPLTSTAQPSELPGNIHCITNPGEAVIGYVTAGSSVESRIFIDNSSLPARHASTPYDQCMLDTLLKLRPTGLTFIDEVERYIYSGTKLPIYPIQPPGSNQILGYVASSPECVDCTLRGTNKQPNFWINQ
ncbi:MAG: hypothetical protein ACHQHN_06370 [Sphingobacteriales bacterium]